MVEVYGYLEGRKGRKDVAVRDFKEVYVHSVCETFECVYIRGGGAAGKGLELEGGDTDICHFTEVSIFLLFFFGIKSVISKPSFFMRCTAGSCMQISAFVRKLGAHLNMKW